VRVGKKATTLLLLVAALHIGALFAGFIAPYDFAKQDRDLIYAAPSRLHFVDAKGRWHWRPSVCLLADHSEIFGGYEEDPQKCLPVKLLVRGSPYKVFGMFLSSRHLFGVEPPAKIALLGSDGYGRDVFSRLVYGSQLSLFSGLLAMALSLLFGALLGIAAGYYGGWLDALVMRCLDLFLALPWLYLLFAIRAFLPLHISPGRVFVLLIAVIGLVGWARPARLIRGVVLSGKERGYVLAARGFGASNFYLMRRHLLPQTYSVLLTQAALLIPQYILAEVTLSFLGLGVGEPAPSWGNMLSTIQQYDVMISYWWMWAPGFVLIPVFFIYQLLGSALQARADYSV
jgi:peptide/nickel transport system permease protein